MRNNFLLVIFFQLIVSCAPFSQVQEKDDLLAYLPLPDENTLLSLHTPVFLIENQKKLYNRIGTPKVKLTEKGAEKIYVDPQAATIFSEKRKFETKIASYTNLIYRIHFSETPYSVFPFHIGAGKNVGLLAIVTLNSSQQPLLYTLVHTCGCYLAFIPTTYLPRSAYPYNWPDKEQVVYAETLPALLEARKISENNHILTILIKDATHRVKNVWLSPRGMLKKFATTSAITKPLSALETLQITGRSETTSFYETSGERLGYVKESHKLFERLFISWWAFDSKIGEDKKLSENTDTPPVFFTSLKPWARTLSDMRDFPTFLSYWGWGL